MTSAEEQRALTHLAELLRKDLSAVDRSELVSGIKQAELVSGAAPAWSGRLIATLYRHTELTWDEISRVTGLSVATAWRRAEPFM